MLHKPALQLPITLAMLTLIAWGVANNALSTPSTDAKAYVSQGLERYNNRDLQGAWLDYTQALTLDPNVAEAYYYRAGVHSFFGNKKGAIADLKQAAELFKAEKNDRYLQLTLKRLSQIKR